MEHRKTMKIIERGLKLLKRVWWYMWLTISTNEITRYGFLGNWSWKEKI